MDKKTFSDSTRAAEAAVASGDTHNGLVHVVAALKASEEYEPTKEEKEAREAADKAAKAKAPAKDAK